MYIDELLCGKLQIQADIYDVPFKVADTDEQAGLGDVEYCRLYRDIFHDCSDFLHRVTLLRRKN